MTSPRRTPREGGGTRVTTSPLRMKGDMLEPVTLMRTEAPLPSRSPANAATQSPGTCPGPGGTRPPLPTAPSGAAPPADTDWCPGVPSGTRMQLMAGECTCARFYYRYMRGRAYSHENWLWVVVYLKCYFNSIGGELLVRAPLPPPARLPGPAATRRRPGRGRRPRRPAPGGRRDPPPGDRRRRPGALLHEPGGGRLPRRDQPLRHAATGRAGLRPAPPEADPPAGAPGRDAAPAHPRQAVGGAGRAGRGPAHRAAARGAARCPTC